MKIFNIILLSLLPLFVYAKSDQFSIVVDSNIKNIKSKKYSNKLASPMKSIVGKAIELMHIDIKNYKKRYSVKTRKVKDKYSLKSDYYVYLNFNSSILNRCDKKCKIDYKIVFEKLSTNKTKTISKKAMLRKKSGRVKMSDENRNLMIQDLKKILIDN